MTHPQIYPFRNIKIYILTSPSPQRASEAPVLQVAAGGPGVGLPDPAPGTGSKGRHRPSGIQDENRAYARQKIAAR